MPSTASRGHPTLVDVAALAQPTLEALDYAPVSAPLPAGGLVQQTPEVTLTLESVSVGPTGFELQIAGTGTNRNRPVIYLNYADKGVLRDDLGNVYRMRMQGDPTVRSDAPFALTLRYAGFPSPLAKSYSLELRVGDNNDSAMLSFQFAAPALPTVRKARRPGWTFSPPISASSAQGNLSVRVRGLEPLADGIALTFDAINGSRDSRASLNSAVWDTLLIDDKGTRMLIAQAADAADREVRMPTGTMMSGRLLFSGQPAPDARHLWLSINSADPKVPRDRTDDNSLAPKIAVDLGEIPADFPRGAKSEHLNLAQRIPTTTKLDVSSLEMLKRELGARESADATVVDLPNDVFFAFDRAELRPEARPVITKVGALLGQVQGPVRIEGHSDAIGKPDYNVALSQRRAQAVGAALVAAGVPANRLAIAGFGATRPRVAERTPEGADDPRGRAINRRVEVVIPHAPR